MRFGSYIALLLLIARAPSALGQAGGLMGGESLTGDVAAAYSTPVAAAANPANAAFIDRTQLEYNPEIFKSETTNVRYPGFAPVAQTDNGSSFLSRPGFILKLGRRLGIGGYYVPGLPMEIDVKKTNVPVMVLNTLNFVDVEGKGKLNGAGQAIVGFKLANSTAVGFNVNYTSFSINAKLRPTEGGDPIAAIAATVTDTNVTLGLRSELVPGRLSLGVAAGVVNIHSEDVQIDSPLLGEAGDETASEVDEEAAPQATTTSTPFSSLLFGMQAALSSGFRILADLQYTRVPKGQERMSLVELKNKPRDVHDTVAARLAAIIATSERVNLLLGAKYEPASLGPGSRGEGGEIGFGTLELVQIWAGFGDLTPYYQFSAGMQYGFAPQTIGTGDERRSYYLWTIATGLVYRRASLGVDEHGELPGAYMHTKTFIPLQLVWRL